MHTKILMIVSAAVMATVGLAASFFPREILQYLDAWDEIFEVGMLQIIGALYLGFAMLNWTARANVMGGLYSRPIALANFTHAGVVAVVLGKIALVSYSLELVAAVIVCAVFAIWFAAVLFSPPKTTKFTSQ